jgi:hypothetical protein
MTGTITHDDVESLEPLLDTLEAEITSLVDTASERGIPLAPLATALGSYLALLSNQLPEEDDAFMRAVGAQMPKLLTAIFHGLMFAPSMLVTLEMAAAQSQSKLSLVAG